MSSFFSSLMQFVVATSTKYNIDESHGLGHSMDVLYYANKIFDAELALNPLNLVKSHERVIYTAAVVHDMCDRKYMVDVGEGRARIEHLLTELKVSASERRAVIGIVDSMSYSKVKETGFPSHGEYQRAFHIVREADLLSAYDFDRCMLYQMHKMHKMHNMSNESDTALGGVNMEMAFEDAEKLFRVRMFRHMDDGLLTTQYARDNHDPLVARATERMESWRTTIARTM
jgi:HD superfamily phosphodiesterase